MRRLIEPSHLDLCCLQKPIIIACGSERVKVNQNTCMLDLRHMKFCFWAYVDSEGPGQLAHRHCLIRTFTVLDSINYINILRYFLANIFNTVVIDWARQTEVHVMNEKMNESMVYSYCLADSAIFLFSFFFIFYTRFMTSIYRKISMIRTSWLIRTRKNSTDRSRKQILREILGKISYSITPITFGRYLDQPVRVHRLVSCSLKNFVIFRTCASGVF